MTITSRALLRLSLVLTTLALAQAADDVLRAGELDGPALVQVLQADLVLLLLVRTPLGPVGAWSSTIPGHAAHAAHATEHLR